MPGIDFVFGVATNPAGDTLLPDELGISVWLRAARAITNKRPIVLSAAAYEHRCLPHGRRYVCIEDSPMRRRSTRTIFFARDWKEALWAGKQVALGEAQTEVLVYAPRSEWHLPGEALRGMDVKTVIVEQVAYSSGEAHGCGLDLATAFRLPVHGPNAYQSRIKKLDSQRVEWHRVVRYRVSI